MKPESTKLSNGLQVITATLPGAYSATVSLYAGVGSRYEDYPHNGGVSHFLEHLLFKGTTKRPSPKLIAEEVDVVGGWTNAYTSNDLTCFYVKTPYQHTELALDILADMLRNSLLNPAEIDRERNVVLEEMNLYHDDPASFVHRLTPPLLWPDHPLANAILGSEEVIQTIPRQKIADYLAHQYQPSKLAVVAAGRVNHVAIVKQAEALLGDMKPGVAPKAVPVTRELATDTTATLTKDTAQVHLVIGTTAYPYRHPNDAAAKIITTILGRGLSSRLFINVRERKGLAYSVTAGVDNFVDTGEFEVYAGVNRAKQAEAIAAIMEELRLIAKQPPAEEELTKAKNQIRGSLQMAMESNSAVADRLGTQQVLLGELRSVEQTLAEIEAVTPADCVRVAAAMLAPERLRMGIISPDPEPAVAAFHKLTCK
ncbi:MAG TPA: pitrilysin family protein [Candidatus Saccharimonadales bacterium]|nr:pitrilysin family protein [Candidatus Saccharimonadales bacterium]